MILVVGDGMQLEHQRAASNYLFGTPEGALEHQKFPYRGAATTWDVTTYDRHAFAASATGGFDARLGYDPARGGKLPYRQDTTGQTAYFGTKLPDGKGRTAAYPATDSASAATALATGVKTDEGNISWRSGDLDGGRLTTIAEMARSQKKAAIGVVSTVPFSHATPAAFVSHDRSRRNYQAIAREIVTVTRPDVVIGGGSPRFNDSAGIAGPKAFQYVDAPEYENLRSSTEYVFVERAPGVDGGAALLSGAEEALTRKKKLFGLFGGEGGNFEFHRPARGEVQVARGSVENPTLADVSRAALRVLSQNGNGFFLLVEQGDIDWANHDDDHASMVGGIWDMNEAVKAIEAFIDQPGNDLTWENTLLVVTSDHGNGFMRLKKDLARGQLPTQTESGGAFHYDPAEVTYGFTGTGHDSHTNELVTVSARGAGAGLFHRYEGLWYPGTTIIDNTHIHEVMMTSMGLDRAPRSAP